MLVAKIKRNVWEEIAQRIRETLNDLERVLRQQPARPARVPVPVPVRPERRDPHR
jgi:hypothetical protein